MPSKVRIDVQGLLQHVIVGKLSEIEPISIMQRTRMNSISEAGAVFYCIAVRFIDRKGTDSGEFLGIGPTGVSRAVRCRE